MVILLVGVLLRHTMFRGLDPTHFCVGHFLCSVSR